MNEKLTKIVITGKVAYEDEITIAQAAQVIGFLNANASGSLPSGGLRSGVGGFAAGAPDEAKVTSPRAALDVTGAKTNPQKIVALAAYVLQDGGETFKLDAIKVQFQRAREATPKNLTRDLSTAIATGWVTETDTPGEYYLTSKVSNVLKDGFFSDGGNGRGRARNSTVKTRRPGNTSRKAKPEVFASIDEFPTVLDDVLPYHQMPTQKDKLLWALWFAKQNNIKGLAHPDAAWLTNELGDGIPSKNLTDRFDSLRKAGHANRSTTDKTLRITRQGEAYLKSITAKND